MLHSLQVNNSGCMTLKCFEKSVLVLNFRVVLNLILHISQVVISTFKHTFTERMAVGRYFIPINTKTVPKGNGYCCLLRKTVCLF